MSFDPSSSSSSLSSSLSTSLLSDGKTTKYGRWVEKDEGLGSIFERSNSARLRVQSRKTDEVMNQNASFDEIKVSSDKNLNDTPVTLSPQNNEIEKLKTLVANLEEKQEQQEYQIRMIQGRLKGITISIIILGITSMMIANRSLSL